VSKITARGGTLSLTFPDGTASFDLGTSAPKWATRSNIRRRAFRRSRQGPLAGVRDRVDDHSVLE